MAPDDPRGWRLGGAAAYCALTAARLGLRVGCLLGVDEIASGATELEVLRAAGVDLRLELMARGPVFENIEHDGHRRQRWLSASDRVAVSALPAEWRDCAAWLLVPVAGEIGDEWASVPAGSALVGTGWQGLIREFSDDGWVRIAQPGPRPLLRRAGLVCASVDDFPAGTDVPALFGLAPDAAVILTAGDGGGLVGLPGGLPGGLRRYRAIPAPTVLDPTGAGDVFLAAAMAVWLTTGELATARALRLAAAAASCSVEGPGLLGVPSLEAIAGRLR